MRAFREEMSSPQSLAHRHVPIFFPYGNPGTPVSRIPHFPVDANLPGAVIGDQDRPLPCHGIKQLPNQLLLLRPWISKKHADLGDVDSHAGVAKWTPARIVG